jgi:hypothetical protein
MTLQSTKLSPQGGTPRQVATAVNQALDGKLACVSTAAVPGSAASLTVTDTQVSANSAVLIVPTSTDAANATVSISDGQFVVTFSPAAAAQTLTYVVLG